VNEKHQDWVSVGEYQDASSAQVVSQRLTIEGIPNRVVFGYLGSTYPSTGSSPCWIWVPPQSADEAKEILKEPPVSDSELAALAMKYPPPDDV
jgi:hypothetical protein